MKEVNAASSSLGVMGTLEQIAKGLGFHDLSSFFMVTVFLVVAIAFVVSCAIFLVKKRRERIDELNKIVAEVQKIEEPLPKPVVLPTVKPAEKKDAIGQKPQEIAKAREIEQPREKPKPREISKVQELAKPAVPFAKKEPVVVVPPPVAEPLEEVIEKPPAPPAPTTRSQLGAALKNTRGGFIEKLSRLFSRGKEISDEDFEEIEAILFTADIGVKTAQKLLDVLRDRVRLEKNADKTFLRTVLKEEMCRILESAEKTAVPSDASPQVFMFVGVNGAGKTTSIGKLGAQLKNAGKNVLFGAGDTFRAAATLQLSVWGERVGAEVVSGKENSDSASVLFEAIEKGKRDNVDYVLCDTAGRLHTKVSLMDELKKVNRVVGKAQIGAPHEVFLVIDATMGQNAISQAREFAAATPLTGVVLSKLDGTAKGGVAIGIVDELKVPIRYVGIGEQVADLKDFDAKLFVDAMFDEA